MIRGIGIGLKLILFICGLGVAQVAFSQATYGGEKEAVHIKAGGGIDYWSTDYSGVWKFGPSAWVGAELWRGLGVQLEGHSLIAGGNLPQYKYYVGEGGLEYTSHHWRTIEPFVKAELGFGSLQFPRPLGLESHDTRTTWAIGGGLEYHLRGRVWTRADYTYDGFPSFLSYVTYQKHTLNPAGLTVGVTYHFK